MLFAAVLITLYGSHRKTEVIEAQTELIELLNAQNDTLMYRVILMDGWVLEQELK